MTARKHLFCHDFRSVRRNLPYSAVIEDLLLFEHCLDPAELDLRTIYLPLQ